MKHILKFAAVGLFFFTLPVFAQIPVATHVAILRAEDARDFDGLKPFIFSKNLAVQKRAVLAAGRIGAGESVDALAGILENGDESIRPIAAFALGETEADHAAPFILRAMSDLKASTAIRSRAVEAAGKIAAANRDGTQSKVLGPAIVSVLAHEKDKRSGPYTELIRAAITAVLRARPEGGAEAVAPFLTYSDQALIADALNTLARLRYKGSNERARELLSTGTDPNVRANAARALGAAEDKEALDLLLKAAIGDTDSRVRVSAIRSLGALKDAKSAEALLKRGEDLLAAYKKSLKPNYVPVEQNEFIEISTALGQILAKTGNTRAIALFREFALVDNFKTVEPYVARVKVGGIRPGMGLGDGGSPPTTYRQYSTLSQAVGELAAYEPESDEGKKFKDEAPEQLRKLATAFMGADPKMEPEAVKAAPDALQAFARFKTEDLGEIARTALKSSDVQTRAAAAGILADQPYSDENLLALNAAFGYAMKYDILNNDAILATLDALVKVNPHDERGSMAAFILATESPDQLVRAKAFTILTDGPYKTRQTLRDIHKAAAERRFKVVGRYFGKGTKMGQVLNTDADYRRAIARKHGSVKAVFTTEKGTFTIDLLPEDAPLTVDNFVKLANAKYFNGLEVHRVVPNFVMQDGDPRGDGNGGPGWSIRCEINMVPYERGAVGMALSGKDTGGSQWFVTHAPQPHLDGGYTVFGRVNETGMKVVDNIVRGDKILTVKIIGR